jgi:hypothetical protein
VRRLAPAAFLLGGLLLTSCGHTDRPEGVVERWLISLNQGAAGRPGAYADARVSEAVLPGWERCDPGALNSIEVGRGEQLTPVGVQGRTTASVPYRIEYTDDIANLCGRTVEPTGPAQGVARLILREPGHDAGDWRVDALAPEPLPGSGATASTPVAQASAAVWLIGLTLGLLLCAAVALLMRATPRPAPLPSEPIDPTEARGL